MSSSKQNRNINILHKSGVQNYPLIDQSRSVRSRWLKLTGKTLTNCFRANLMNIWESRQVSQPQLDLAFLR